MWGEVEFQYNTVTGAAQQVAVEEGALGQACGREQKRGAVEAIKQ